MQYQYNIIRVYFALQYSEHAKHLRGVRIEYTVLVEISDRRCNLEELDIDGRHCNESFLKQYGGSGYDVVAAAVKDGNEPLDLLEIIRRTERLLASQEDCVP